MNITVGTLLEDKEYLVEQFSETIDEEMKSTLKTLLVSSGYDIPLIVEVMVPEVRKAFRTKEGQMAFQKAVSVYEDSSNRLEAKLNCFELLFDDKLTEAIILLILYMVDDTICIEDYLDLEDIEDAE